MADGKIIFINGPINSGKSTIARLLSDKINGEYIEGDLAISSKNLLFEEWISKTVTLIVETGCSLARSGKNVCISYPLRVEDWKIILKIAENNNIEILCITLSPKLETALSERGHRKLEPNEQNRIKEMYLEGYQNREFSNLIIKNDNQSPEDTVNEILNLLA